jgi:hypothetical protein
VKIWIAALAFVSLVGMASAQDDEKSPLDKLKEAVAKKDPDSVKSLAAETLKWAQGMINAPKPTDAGEVKDWESRIESGKEVTTYTEYALSTTAVQAGSPAKTVDLVDTLIAQNPKSKYLDDVCANAYLVALGKVPGGTQAKQLDGMAKIVKGRPDNIVALMALIDARPSLQYANELVAAARKTKPEGVADSEWEKTKNEALGKGYYHLGTINGQKQGWLDCDKYLKLAVPLLQGATLGSAYFNLGICDYKFGEITADRTKKQAGQQYMEKSAAIKGPYQTQAYQQNNAMKQALVTGR